MGKTHLGRSRKSRIEQTANIDGSVRRKPGNVAGAGGRSGREPQWLHDALNPVARVRAEQGGSTAFRLMQQQAMAVGQRRVKLRKQMAQLEALSTDLGDRSESRLSTWT
jgi:hypothetical protein